MTQESTPKKKAVLFCTCSGACPSMAKIDFWALSERVRLELGEKIEFMALHPRLCEEDGERLMGQVLNDQIQFITPACAEKRQEKLLRDGFEKAGVPMDRPHWFPVSMAQEDTESVYQKIKAALENRSPDKPQT
jgi:heterodisulfide reductase subunit A-like polyferredoxin